MRAALESTARSARAAGNGASATEATSSTVDASTAAASATSASTASKWSSRFNKFELVFASEATALRGCECIGQMGAPEAQVRLAARAVGLNN